MEAESAVECRVILDRRGDGLEHDLVMLTSLPATLLFVARLQQRCMYSTVPVAVIISEET